MTNPLEAALSQLVPRSVGAYNSVFTMPTVSGSSDFVPFDTTEYETDSSMHDPTVGDSGTAAGSQTSTTLQDTLKSWTTDQFVDHIVQITGGTGSGQWRKIVSNNANTLSVGAWSTTPDGTSTYRITEKSTRLVAPVDGKYLVTAHASIQYQAEVLGILFYVNGAFKTVHYVHQSKSIELQAMAVRAFELSKDDYVEMKIYNGNGSPRDLFAGSFRLFFQLHKVG